MQNANKSHTPSSDVKRVSSPTKNEFPKFVKQWNGQWLHGNVSLLFSSRYILDGDAAICDVFLEVMQFRVDVLCARTKLG